MKKYITVQFYAPQNNINSSNLSPQRYTYTATAEQVAKLTGQPENRRYAVVAAPGRNGPIKLVKVVDISDVLTYEGRTSLRPVIDVVDVNKYLEHEEKLRRAEEIERTLEARAAEIAAQARLAALAGQDPSLKALFDELTKLKADL